MRCGVVHTRDDGAKCCRIEHARKPEKPIAIYLRNLLVRNLVVTTKVFFNHFIHHDDDWLQTQSPCPTGDTVIEWRAHPAGEGYVGTVTPGGSVW